MTHEFAVPTPLMRRMRPLLGTYVEVGIHQMSKRMAPALAVDAAFESLAQAQSRWSFQDGHSELSRLNARPGRRVEMAPQTLRLLRVARLLMRRSEGRFDCTVGGVLVRTGALPDHGGAAPLARGVVADIELGHGWACLRRPVRLTLDGIAKGFAVDLAIGRLRRCGVMAGWINAGGDLRAFGDVALPVQRRQADGRLAPMGCLRNAALATSRVGKADAAYPGRLVALPGQRPAYGLWSVLARSAWRADALTKVAAATPADARRACIEALGGCLVECSSAPYGAGAAGLDTGTHLPS